MFLCLFVIVQWHRPRTLQCLVTIVSLHFLIVLGVQLKLCLGGNYAVSMLFSKSEIAAKMATA